MADKKITFDVLANAKATGFDKAARYGDNLNKSAEKSHKNLGLLSTAIVGLGPALIPVTAAASVALVGLAGAAGTGLLAFEGLRKEWKNGTLQLTPLGAQIKTLQRNLTTLETVAANGVAPGFTQGLRDINSLMPTVRTDVHGLADQLGQIGGHLGAGVVELFTRLNPLFTALGNELVRDSQQFQRWATSSDSITHFVQYAQQQLPRVEETIKALFVTASHIVQAFAGFGGNTLTLIQLFSRAINLIPIGALQALAPAIVGLKVASTVSAAVGALTASLEKMALAEGTASAATGLLATTLSTALNPAIAATIGLYYLLGPVLDKIAGNTGTFSDQINTLRDSALGVIPPTDHFVNGVLVPYGPAAINAANATAGLGKAQANAGVVIDGVSESLTKQTTALNKTRDAASLLKDAFDRLNGTALSVEQTQNTFLDTLGNLQKRTKTYNGTLDQANATGRANREVIVQAIQSANDHAQAIANQTAKQRGLGAGLRAGVSDFKAHEDAIRKAAAAAGLDKDQVQALINKLGKVPKSIVTAVSVRDTASGQIATIKANLAALKSKQIDITTYVQNVVLPTLGKQSVSRDSHRATGGRVLGGRRYMVNELGQELFVRDNDGAFLIPGGPHQWTAPASGQIINASTIRSLRNKVGNLAGASLQAIPSTAKSLISAVSNILPFGSPITRALEQEDKQLEALVARRVHIANRLKIANQQLVSAQQALANTQQAFNQEARTVQTGVTGSFDLLNAGKDVYGTISAAGILSDLRGSVNNASQFANLLRRLRGRIPSSVLQQLAEAGPSALPTLQALAGASPLQLRQFGALETQLGSLGAAAGRTTASALFGAQLRSQQNLVLANERLIRSLQSQEKATERLERQLGQTIVKSVNITIHGGSAQEIVKTLDRYFARGGTLNSHGRIR